MMSEKNDEMDMLFGEDDDEEEQLTRNQQIFSKLAAKESLAEIKTIANIGGERGLFAKFHIPAGSLILSEIPVIVWPECDLTDIENLIQVLRLVCMNQKAIDTTKNLHPRILQHADNEEIVSAQETVTLERLTEIAHESTLETDEVLRIFLTLQHNGFSSGLYEFLSIANHSCQPNCIKFMPVVHKNAEGELATCFCCICCQC